MKINIFYYSAFHMNSKLILSFSYCQLMSIIVPDVYQRITGASAFGGKMDASYLRSSISDEFEIPATPSNSYSLAPSIE